MNLNSKNGIVLHFCQHNIISHLSFLRICERQMCFSGVVEIWLEVYMSYQLQPKTRLVELSCEMSSFFLKLLLCHFDLKTKCSEVLCDYHYAS
jgi:hypothetical protein